MTAVTAARPPVSPLRIGAFSATLALHLIAFGLLLLPPQLLLKPVSQTVTDVLIAEIVERVVTPPPPPVPPPPQPPVRPPTPAPSPTPVTVTLAPPTPMSIPAPPQPASTAVEAIGDPAPPAVSRAAQIALDVATPPPYPPLSRRRGEEGEVLLRVRVDRAGRPLEVMIERSSGHRLLDRSASAHVLARWRFQPALQAGVAVEAWARVPVRFRLEQG